MALTLLGEPRDLGEVRALQAQLARCGFCGAYWSVDAYHPYTISAEAAAGHLPDLGERERRAGL